jgi:DNA replication ATP-dependent helicase Dna2
MASVTETRSQTDAASPSSDKLGLLPDSAEETDPNRAAMAAYLARAEKLVRDEAEASRNRVFAIWSKPIPERVGTGHAIEGIAITRTAAEGGIHLKCAQNRSRFREGDILCLNQGDPFSQPKLMVTLDEDRGAELVVSPYDQDLPPGELHKDQSSWMLDEGFIDLYHYFLDALREVGESSIGRERILPFLMGHNHPALDPARMERGLAQGEAADLNWSQCEALAHAYATDSLYLIQGPPGTGKTRVLAHLAELLAEDGERVLVTAFTHRAINNALNMLAKVAPLTSAAKIGHPSRTDDLDVECYGNFDSSPMASMDKGYVIGATPFATRTQRLAGVEFDTVIFDEASQITVPLAVMAMLTAKRYVFIGDHKQLPPVLVSNPPGEAFRRSIFGDLADHGFDTMLRETYRLNQELVEWPNRQFYSGQLQPVEEIASRTIAYPRQPERYGEILRPDRPKVFLDMGHRNTTTRSTIEAGIIVDLIVTLLDCGLAAREIAVVTPYRAQAREIRTLLAQAVGHSNPVRDIVIDTVERMQGQERDLILLSLTTSNPAFALNLADFFFQPERLNVSVTRARSKLIIVGSTNLFQAQPEEPELQEAIALLEDLVKSCDYLVPER